MINKRIIKAETVNNAIEIYGKDKVNIIFDLIGSNLPEVVMENIEDKELKGCLLYLFGGDLRM